MKKFTGRCNKSFQTPWIHSLKVAAWMLLFFSVFSVSDGKWLQGCNVEPKLCSYNEICHNDRAIGQCATESEWPSLMNLNTIPDIRDKEIILSSLGRYFLNNTLEDPHVQCFITFYKFSRLHGLKFDKKVCKEDANEINDFIVNMHKEIESMSDNEWAKFKDSLIDKLTTKTGTEIKTRKIPLNKNSGKNLRIAKKNVGIVDVMPLSPSNDIPVMIDSNNFLSKDMSQIDDVPSFENEADYVLVGDKEMIDDADRRLVGIVNGDNNEILPIIPLSSYEKNEIDDEIKEEMLKREMEKQILEAAAAEQRLAEAEPIPVFAEIISDDEMPYAANMYDSRMDIDSFDAPYQGSYNDNELTFVADPIMEENIPLSKKKSDIVPEFTEEFDIVPVVVNNDQLKNLITDNDVASKLLDENTPIVVDQEGLQKLMENNGMPSDEIIPIMADDFKTPSISYIAEAPAVINFRPRPVQRSVRESELVVVPVEEEEDIFDETGGDVIIPADYIDETELQNILDNESALPRDASELEEVIPLGPEIEGPQLLLKKDDEKFVNEDQGLDKVEHKIVKGNQKVSKIEGNRVYVQLKKKELKLKDVQKLADYLQEKVGIPSGLIFSDFAFEDGQLSFTVERFDDNGNIEKRVETPSQVAQAVYKRRKDILTLSGIELQESGIGSGHNIVPVASSGTDWLFKPILIVCMATVTSLLVVVIVQFLKSKKGKYETESYYPKVIDHLDNIEGGKGATSAAYEDLCRRRMSNLSNGAQECYNNNRTKLAGTSSKNSSVSSWPDEALMSTCNLDISTGHMILSFLQEYLDNPKKLHDEWESVSSYYNSNDTTSVAAKRENLPKNRNQQILPYDETLVKVSQDAQESSKYINASYVYDADPKHPTYIVAECPLVATTSTFWQMIWEKGVILLVNLTTKEDMTVGRCEKYWPDDGTFAYDHFDVSLVSEHIWSEDYMVRSFTLCNNKTNESRTITQFHYLNWTENKVVPNQKTLLDFRRKINKSYRGKASPILVHDSEGLGRSGAFILLDILSNRICSGVKEINMAASLEYLRDQRNGAVNTEEQYKMVFNCLAEEVTSLIKNLPN